MTALEFKKELVKKMISDIKRANNFTEVVRCKDCEYLMFSDMFGECGRGHMGIVSPNDYCSRGVRKGEGE